MPGSTLHECRGERDGITVLIALIQDVDGFQEVLEQEDAVAGNWQTKGGWRVENRMRVGLHLGVASDQRDTVLSFIMI